MSSQSTKQIVWDLCSPANSSFKIPDTDADGLDPINNNYTLPNLSEIINSIPQPKTPEPLSFPPPLELGLCKRCKESWDIASLLAQVWQSCQFCIENANNSHTLTENEASSQESSQNLRTPNTRATYLNQDNRLHFQVLNSIRWNYDKIASYYGFTYC
jgi:hypothetical protein